MGKFSRSKGSRVEREVVHYLRSIGYQAERVPLSGATTYAKGDVRVIVGGEQRFIEVKSRKEAWSTIFDLMDSGASILLNRVFISPNFDNTLNGIAVTRIEDASKRTVTLLENLKKLKVDCDFLALKVNHKPILYLRWT